MSQLLLHGSFEVIFLGVVSESSQNYKCKHWQKSANMYSIFSVYFFVIVKNWKTVLLASSLLWYDDDVVILLLLLG